jgi:hypothetical protein
MAIHSTYTRILAIILAVATFSHPSIVFGQANPFSDSLLASIRAAAQSIPGPHPRELRYITIGEAHPRLSNFVAGADTQRVTTVFPAFQIRFANRWIMVDAGMDSSAIIKYYGSMAGLAYSKTSYDSLQLGLRDADVIVLTHEHFDHANGVQSGPYFRQVDGMKEDRAAIQREIDWVRSIIDNGSIAVAPSHDKQRLDALVGQRLLSVGLDLRHN